MKKRTPTPKAAQPKKARAATADPKETRRALLLMQDMETRTFGSLEVRRNEPNWDFRDIGATVWHVTDTVRDMAEMIAKRAAERTATPEELADILRGMDRETTVNGFDIMRAASGPDLQLFHVRRTGSRTWSARRTAHGVQEIVFPPAIPTRDAEQKAIRDAARAQRDEKAAARLAELDELLEGLSTARKAAERDHSKALVARIGSLVLECGFTFEEAKAHIEDKPGNSTYVAIAAAHVATIRAAILEIEALRNAAAEATAR